MRKTNEGTLIYDFAANCYAIRYPGSSGEHVSDCLPAGQQLEILINDCWCSEHIGKDEDGFYLMNHPDKNGFGCQIKLIK